MKQLLFYGNVVDDELRARREITSDSPAASRKMLGLCRALRRQGVRASVISLGRGSANRSGRLFRTEVRRVEGVPVVFGPMLHAPIASELLSMAWLLRVAVGLARKRHGEVRHLFYNQLIFYLPALFWLWLRGQRTLVDIEDGPLDLPAKRGRGNAPPHLFAQLISDGAFLACSALGGGTSIRPVIPYYGATQRQLATEKDWNAARLRVLFSGTLSPDTGVGMLVKTLERFLEAEEPLGNDLHFDICGFGPGLEALATLQAGAQGPSIALHGRVDLQTYRRLLDSAHIGLSLKPTGGVLANSTFPSKVVEYAESGLCVIATDISDVRSVFGDAFLYITRNEPGELAERLRELAADRVRVACLAAAGRAVTSERFSEETVGREAAAFLFPERAA